MAMRTDNTTQRLVDNEISTLGTRAYYFHPDEDFREDWDWGRMADTDAFENESYNTPY